MNLSGRCQLRGVDSSGNVGENGGLDLVALAYGRSHGEGQALLERNVAETRAAQGDAVTGSKLAGRDVAAIFRPHLMIGGEIELVASGRLQTVDGFGARWKDVVDEMRLPVAADREDRFADKLANTHRTIGGGDERIARNARVGGVDSVVVGTGM